MQELRTLVEARADTLARGAGECRAAACALLLVAEGYPLDPDLQLPESVRSAAGPELRQALRATADALARRLALAHWLLVALPFAPPPPDEEKAKEIPPGARRGPAPFPGDRGDYGPPGAPTFGDHGPSPALPPLGYDVYTDTSLAPLRRIADLTAGAIARVPDQLPTTLASLRDRRWIWYRTTRFAPQEVRTLEVLAGDPAHRVLAPAWVGSPP
jgi:hypothetical protein